MKIFYSPSSPFVRKVMVAAHELGLADRFDRLPAAAHPVNRDDSIRPSNPLAQVPTLITDDGDVLFDSRVICEYLDQLGGGSLFGSGRVRWRNLSRAAMGDGLLNAALLARYEGFARPAELRWPAWVEGQFGKVSDVLDKLEQMAPHIGAEIDIGTISLACGVSYLDFRFPEREWRFGRPAAAEWFAEFGQRASMRATEPTG